MKAKILAFFVAFILVSCQGQTWTENSTPTTATSSGEQSQTSSMLKEYLMSKGIFVAKMKPLEGASGIYQATDSHGDFYIDQNKNVLFGMIVNLDDNVNVTLSKQNSKVSPIIDGGYLQPFPKDSLKMVKKSPNPLGKYPLGASGAVIPPMMPKTPAEYDETIKSLEQGLAKLKEERSLLETKER